MISKAANFDDADRTLCRPEEVPGQALAREYRSGTSRAIVRPTKAVEELLEVCVLVLVRDRREVAPDQRWRQPSVPHSDESCTIALVVTRFVMVVKSISVYVLDAGRVAVDEPSRNPAGTGPRTGRIARWEIQVTRDACRSCGHRTLLTSHRSANGNRQWAEGSPSPHSAVARASTGEESCAVDDRLEEMAGSRRSAATVTPVVREDRGLDRSRAPETGIPAWPSKRRDVAVGLAKTHCTCSPSSPHDLARPPRAAASAAVLAAGFVPACRAEYVEGKSPRNPSSERGGTTPPR
jgi:hypothetical protein